MNYDGAEDVIVAINSTKNLCSALNPINFISSLGGILCAKASMRIQLGFFDSLEGKS